MKEIESASFLGCGWSFPPSFGAQCCDVDTVSGAEDVHQSLQILLATRPGERVMQEAFGCDLHGVMFGEVDQGLLNTVSHLVRNAILDYEPRIDLEVVDVGESDAEAGLLFIRIRYAIRETNSRFNLVYPFYLRETSFR